MPPESVIHHQDPRSQIVLVFTWSLGALVLKNTAISRIIRQPFPDSSRLRYREQIMKNYPKSKKLMPLVSIIMVLCVGCAITERTIDHLMITKAMFEQRNILFAKFQHNLVQILLRNVTSRLENSPENHSDRVQTGKLTRQASVQ